MGYVPNVDFQRGYRLGGLNIRALAFCAAIFGTASQPVLAQQYLRSGPIIVQNDRGGLLYDRINRISALRRSGQSVRINGRICYSTCTLYLGLPKLCISPDTVFGFHGPSSFGHTLDPKTFNETSRTISQYYPAELRKWYMETARYNIRTLRKLRGSAIIKMGIKAC